MKALTYHGSKDVRVETVPDPRLVESDDIILRVTATAICGSDLHIYRGKIPMMEHGDILGHEFMGIVEEVGSSVLRVKRGDRVVIPFTISCGQCFYCDKKLFAACETTNTGRGAIVNKKDTRAGAYGIEPINFDQVDDPAKFIIDQMDGRGVDSSIDAVGFEAKGSAIESALTAVK